MINVLEILVVCGRKKLFKNILCNNVLWFNNL